MELYIDIADPQVIRQAAAYYPIDGFTTNPKILASSSRPVTECMAEYRTLAQQEGLKAFFQVTANTAEEMLNQAKSLQDYIGNNFVVKIPATKEGYRAVTLCKHQGIPVTVTVIHTMMQALMAAKAGADYVAPYVSHIDNLGEDGIACVADMVTAFRNGGYPCKVLGASFRTVGQIRRLALAGCHAVTVLPAMLEQLISCPSTDAAMNRFSAAWLDAFGQRGISDLIPPKGGSRTLKQD